MSPWRCIDTREGVRIAVISSEMEGEVAKSTATAANGGDLHARWRARLACFEREGRSVAQSRGQRAANPS